MRHQFNIPNIATPLPILQANTEYAETEAAYREVQEFINDADTYRQLAEEADGRAGAELLKNGGDPADITTEHSDAFLKKLVVAKAQLVALNQRAQDAYNDLDRALDEYRDEWVDNLFTLLYETDEQYKEALQRFVEMRNLRDGVLKMLKQVNDPGAGGGNRRRAFIAEVGDAMEDRADKTSQLSTILAADRSRPLPLPPGVEVNDPEMSPVERQMEEMRRLAIWRDSKNKKRSKVK